MHGTFDKRRLAKKQGAAPITFHKRSLKPKKRALGPMTVAARLRTGDWLAHQVFDLVVERPPSYNSIATALVRHFNDSDGTAYPSLATLAALCGISKSMAAKVIGLHLADGNIRVVDQGKPGRGHSTTYAIVTKPLPDDVAEGRRRVALREDRRKRAANRQPASHLN